MSTLSRNGKKASEASAVPFTSSPASRALMTAILVESILDIWPAPMPMVRPSLASIMALLFTCLQTLHAKRRSSSSLSFGPRFVTVLRSEALSLSSVWSNTPPQTLFMSKSEGQSSAFIPQDSSTRRFFLAPSTSSASLSNAGATTASRNILFRTSAISFVTFLLKPTIPPKAEVLSHA